MKNGTVGGASFFGLLTIAFIVLKLAKVIDWSWIWVVSPMWIEAILLLIIYLIVIRGER